MNTIGALSDWEETNDQVYDNFARTGDWMTNSRPHLETVINAGVRTIVYDGDAVSLSVPERDARRLTSRVPQDYILNFNGVEAMVLTSLLFSE